MKRFQKRERSYAKAPVDNQPSVPYKPLPSFSGSIHERLQRSPEARKVQEDSAKRKMGYKRGQRH